MKFGKSDRPDDPRESLTIIEQSILEQIKTFGMTTRIAWRKSKQLREFDDDLIVQSLRELTNRKIIESHSLHYGKFYFVFTNHAVQAVIFGATDSGPFSERNKTLTYARLLAGLIYLPNTVPLSRSKLIEMLGDDAVGLPNVLLMDTDTQRYYWMRIDAAIHAKPERMAQQLRSDIFRITKIDSFRDLIRAKRFDLVLATCTGPRNEAILRRFRAYDRVGATPIRSLVIPELLPLLTSVPIGGALKRQNNL